MRKLEFYFVHFYSSTKCCVTNISKNKAFKDIRKKILKFLQNFIKLAKTKIFI